MQQTNLPLVRMSGEEHSAEVIMGKPQAWLAAVLAIVGASAASAVFAAGRGPASQPATATAPAAPAGPAKSLPPFVIVKPAPLPKGMEDYKTTETAQRGSIKGGRGQNDVPEPGY